MDRLKFGALVLAAALGAACTPVKETHGFIPDENVSTDVAPGVDTKATVQARLGSPSTTGVFDASTAWYYITTNQTRYAFYDPKTVSRQVIAIRFGADDIVAGVEKYGLEKGKVIAYSGDKTPTRGRELGILEQLLGNLGQAPPIRTDEDEQNQNRR